MAAERLYNNFIKSLEWHSSPVDWCEPNYAVTSSTVEFYNTITNIIFVICPPILMCLFHPYGSRVTQRIHIVWVLMILVGLSSAYFHGTLTLAGQLLDEYGIIWMVMACLAFWFPKNVLPASLETNRNRLEILILIVTVLFTLLGFVWPLLNAFIMMSCSVPIVMLIRREMNRSKDKQAKYVAKQSIVLWLVAVLVWLSDRFLCGAWLSIGVPGVHWLWHIISGVCGYRSIVFFVYRDAVMYHSDLKPVLACWPSDKWRNIGLLYIKLESALPVSVGKQRSGVASQYNTDDNHNYNYDYFSKGEPVTERGRSTGRSKRS